MCSSKTKSSTNEAVESSNFLIKFNRELELDSKFGLHDYDIYLCMRNQTKTTFLSLNQHVFAANIIKCILKLIK